MANDTSRLRSRRTLLAAAAGAAAATVAEAVIRPLPAAAAGNDGAVVHIGNLFADARSQTTWSNKANDEIVLWVASNADLGHGGGTAVVGFSDHGRGLHGWSPHGTGVFGESSNGFGVRGRSESNNGVVGQSPTGNGVFGGSGTAPGVRGESSSGPGVSGQSTSAVGVSGYSSGATGVEGTSTHGTGVVGDSQGGIGVEARSTGGTALHVDGPAAFSRSGRASVPAGRTSVDVTVPGGLAGSPNILATLQLLRPGVHVAAVRPNFPSSGNARIYLNKVASPTAATPVAWFVIG